MEFFEITTKDQALEFCKIMPDIVAIDTEFVKGDPRTTQLLSVIVADSTRAWVIPPSLLPVLISTIRSRKIVFLQDYNHCDTIILLKHGCDLRQTECHNLIDMHHLIDENADHSLGSRILLKYQDNYKSKFWDKYKNFEDADFQDALEYQCKDAIYTYRLGVQDLPKINKELYNHIRQLSVSLLETELNGIVVNTKLIQDTKDSVEKQINECLPKLREQFLDYCKMWELQEWQKKIDKLSTERGKQNAVKPVFSFSSDKQLQWLIYEGLQLPIKTKTKKGNPSTDYDTLKVLSEENPILKSVFEYKELKALYSTFIEGMLERVDNGRIYPHFNVSGTSTGRISHSNPNMGNLPRQGIIRNFFIPNKGMVIIGADYSQLEVVVELNLTEDPKLKEIILEGASKHDITAEGLKINRNDAKTLNFALQYGAGTKKISKILGIGQSAAEDIFKRYWELYSGVYALKEKVEKEIQNKGEITNSAGRIRRFPKAKNEYEQAKYSRQAYNFLIQGIAAECCNRAYYRFHNHIEEIGIGRGLFSVHDEIVGEVKEGWDEIGKDILINFMEASNTDFNFKYPIKAVSYGPLKFWTKT